MTKRTFLRPSDHRGWVLLCFAFYLLSQLIRGTTPTQEVLNSIPSTSSSIHFNTQISFPVAPQHPVSFFDFFGRLFQNQWNFEMQKFSSMKFLSCLPGLFYLNPFPVFLLLKKKSTFFPICLLSKSSSPQKTHINHSQNSKLFYIIQNPNNFCHPICRGLHNFQPKFFPQGAKNRSRSLQSVLQ